MYVSTCCVPRHIRLASMLAVIVVFGGQTRFEAQQAAFPRTPTGKPNLTGVWQALGTAAWDLEDHTAQLGVPGGLGVVEGSLTIALVAYGGGYASTVAAVLVYRMISFWGMLPPGWVCWAVCSWTLRKAESASLVTGPTPSPEPAA